MPGYLGGPFERYYKDSFLGHSVRKQNRQEDEQDAHGHNCAQWTRNIQFEQKMLIIRGSKFESCLCISPSLNFFLNFKVVEEEGFTKSGNYRYKKIYAAGAGSHLGVHPHNGITRALK